MRDDNAKYASDVYELKAMNLIDEVWRHPLRKSGEARAVLVSSHLHFCCEAFKRENDKDGVDLDHSITSIQGLEVAVGEDLEDDEWHVLTGPEYEEAVADGRLRWRSFGGGVS